MCYMHVTHNSDDTGSVICKQTKMEDFYYIVGYQSKNRK